MNNFNRLANLFNSWLGEYRPIPGLLPRLNEAAQSALIGGGKRFRPVLCLTVGEVLGVPNGELRNYALGLEMIHAASLVHDDLPGLDNSDERRGRPTVHREFGEAAAIMAGDLLISEAFRTIAEGAGDITSDVRCHWIAELATTNGFICSGQLREIDDTKGELSEIVIREKTASLIKASVMGAPILLDARLGAEKRVFWSDFGIKLGMLFQLRDDQLDDEAGAEHRAMGDRLFRELLTMSEAEQLRELVEFVWKREV